MEVVMIIRYVITVLLLLPLHHASATSSSTATSTGIRKILRRLEQQRASPSVQESAARGVLHRLLPSHLSSFRLRIIPQGTICSQFNCFRISSIKNSSSGGPEILIQGSTAVEISSGLHWHLKYWCGAHISWDKTGGAQLASVPPPGSLPRVRRRGVLVERPVPWSYYQNVVTSSCTYLLLTSCFTITYIDPSMETIAWNFTAVAVVQ